CALAMSARLRCGWVRYGPGIGEMPGAASTGGDGSAARAGGAATGPPQPGGAGTAVGVALPAPGEPGATGTATTGPCRRCLGAGAGGGCGIGSGGTGTGTAGAVSGGAGTAGCGLTDSGTGSGSSGGGAGMGSLDCSVSGNCFVAFSGTLDSGVFENTDMSVL